MPNGSLKVRTTAATLVRFHMGPKMRFPNLQNQQETSEFTLHGNPSLTSGLSNKMLPQNHQVLDHLLAQVVVYAVELILFEHGGQMSRQLVRALEVPAKRFLNNDPVPPSAFPTQSVRLKLSHAQETFGGVESWVKSLLTCYSCTWLGCLC